MTWNPIAESVTLSPCFPANSPSAVTVSLHAAVGPAALSQVTIDSATLVFPQHEVAPATSTIFNVDSTDLPF